jgi:hypothetical protein
MRQPGLASDFQRPAQLVHIIGVTQRLVLIKPLNALSFLPKAIFLTLGWHIIDT